ncbi:MAG: DUF357 domain-containing protein, partial [Fervidicoccaceae archaeon]
MSDACSRASLYISMVKDALAQAKRSMEQLPPEDLKLVELSELYVKDADYYLSREDCTTAIAAISYAEGLLDSLALRGKLKIEWKREKAKKVVIAGTFDILHPGHVYFMKQAAQFGELYVIVSRDVNVKKIKGRETIFPEKSRLEMVKSIRWVKDAVLGDEEDFLKRVVELSPDILILGPDQKVDEIKLKEELERRGVRGIDVRRLEKRNTNV